MYRVSLKGLRMMDHYNAVKGLITHYLIWVDVDAEELNNILTTSEYTEFDEDNDIDE
jgi:hypothetical protein